jgi:hypothetical protein
MAHERQLPFYIGVVIIHRKAGSSESFLCESVTRAYCAAEAAVRSSAKEAICR